MSVGAAGRLAAELDQEDKDVFPEKESKPGSSHERMFIVSSIHLCPIRINRDLLDLEASACILLLYPLKSALKAC